jgi:hypothetical protein
MLNPNKMIQNQNEGENTMVDSKVAVQNLRKRLQTKATNCSIMSVEIGSDADKNQIVDTTVVPMPENKALRMCWIPIEKKISIPVGNGIKVIVKDEKYPFSKTLINVHLDDLDKADQITREMFVRYNGANTKKMYWNGTMLWDLDADCEVKTSLVFKEDGELKRGVRRYVGFGFSPSKLRQTCLFMIDVTNGFELVEQMLDSVTSGAYSQNKGKQVNLKQLIKLVARMFQWTAPSVALGTIECYGMVMGEFAAHDGLKPLDGMSFILNESYAKWSSETLDVSVSAKAVTGEMIQNRPYTAKQSGNVVDRTFMEALVSKYEVVRFNHDEITTQVSEAIQNGLKNKGVLAGKLVIIGQGIPDIIMDANGVKADFDFSLKGTFDVLGIAKRSQAYLSEQMFQKVVNKDARAAYAMAKDLFQQQVIAEVTSTILERKPMVPSVDEISDNPWLTSIASKIAPKYVVEKDTAMYRTIVDAMIQRHGRFINKMRLELAGSNLRIIADVSLLLAGERILKFGEVFAKDAERYFKNLDVDEESWKVSMFKYPTMGEKEYYAARVVGLTELKKRIRALNIDRKVKNAITGFYATLSDSVVVVPAVEELKKLLAGMDFDYDGCTVIYNAEFNRILHTDNKPFVVDIQAPKEQKKAPVAGSLRDKLVASNPYKNSKMFNDNYTFEIPSFIAAFLKQVRSGNQSVGHVTNTNTIQIAMSKRPSVAKEALLELFEEGAKETYIGLKHEDLTIDGVECKLCTINEAAIDGIIAEIPTVKFTKENIKKIFDDLNVMFRYYQERIIDAAKDGSKVNVKLEVGRVIYALSLCWIAFNADWQTGTFDFKVLSEGKDKTFEDLGFKFKTILFSEYKDLIEESIMKTKQEFDSNELARFEMFAGKAHRSLVESLSMLKRLYNDLVAGYVEELENARGNEEHEAVAKQSFKDNIAVLSSFARALTKEMSPVDRARIAKYASMINKAGLRTDGGSQFANIVLPHEYLLMLLEDYAEVDFAGEKLIVNKGVIEGDVVEFKHGISELCMIEADINGEFEIRMFNDKLYASKLIKDLVTVPSIEDVAPIKLKDSSIMGREDEVKTLLADSNEVFISAKTTRIGNRPVHDYALYVVNNDAIVKVADIDTIGDTYNKLIDGNKAKVVNVIVNTVTAFNSNKKKTSMIVVVKDLEQAVLDTTSFAEVEIGDEGIEIGDVIENDNSL